MGSVDKVCLRVRGTDMGNGSGLGMEEEGDLDDAEEEEQTMRRMRRETM